MDNGNNGMTEEEAEQLKALRQLIQQKVDALAEELDSMGVIFNINVSHVAQAEAAEYRTGNDDSISDEDGDEEKLTSYDLATALIDKGVPQAAIAPAILAAVDSLQDIFMVLTHIHDAILEDGCA